jgi:hypothetical protein
MLLDYFPPIMEQLIIGKQPTQSNSDIPFQSSDDSEKVIAIYRPWVDRWALNSKNMLEWVMGYNVLTKTFNLFNLNARQQKLLYIRLRILSNNKAPVPEPWDWVWSKLLTKKYRRLDQSKRSSARTKLKNKGFYRIRENSIWKHAYYWIMFYILGCSETDLTETFNIPLQSMSRMLKPFNTALLEPYRRPKPGRPEGAKTTAKAKREQDLKREEKLEKTALRVRKVSAPGRCPRCASRLFNNECLMCGYQNYEK